MKDKAEAWAVAKTMRPHGRGAVKLARTFGEALMYVRYRVNPDETERLTTVELVVERAIIQKRADPVVAFKIRYGEGELLRLAQAKGAKFDARTKLWKLPRSEVLRMGLRHRIAVPLEQIMREQRHG